MYAIRSYYVRASAHRRRNARAGRVDRARQESQAYHRGGGRPGGGQGRHPESPGRLAGDGAEARRRYRPGGGAGGGEPALQPAARLHRLRRLLPRDHPADVV